METLVGIINYGGPAVGIAMGFLILQLFTWAIGSSYRPSYGDVTFVIMFAVIMGYMLKP